MGKLYSLEVTKFSFMGVISFCKTVVKVICTFPLVLPCFIMRQVKSDFVAIDCQLQVQTLTASIGVFVGK